MKCKKILAMLLAAVMTAGCLAGCGQQAVNNKESESVPASNVGTESDASSETPEETSLFNEPGTLPIVNEPITLKVITQDQTNTHTGNEADKSKLWAWLEEKTGVHFEVESYPIDELKQKLPLLMATPDDMPDMFWRCDLTASDILSYGQNGQLLKLDELLEEYAPNVQECFDTVDGAYGAAVAADGNIYSLPSYNASVANVMIAMNQQFLDNTGKKAPTTFEELYDVFKAIQAHGDANGDGTKNNEYCWSDEYKNFRRTAMAMGGLNCYWPWEGCLFDSDGNEVFFALTSDRYKDLLTWLNKFYEEGMIDPETFTQTTAEKNAKSDANRTFLKEKVSDPESASWNGVEGDFWPVPVKMYEEDTPLITIGASYQTDIGAVSAYTEYPEICVMVMDFLFTEEGSMVASMGMDGVDFNVVSEDPFIIEKIEGHGANEELSEYALCVPRWKRDEWVQPASTQHGRDRNELIKEYGVFAFQNYLKFTAEESDAIATASADLGLYCNDYFVGFVNGTYDIEKDWDAYVAECKKMKSEELTEIYQKAFNRYYGLD